MAYYGKRNHVKKNDDTESVWLVSYADMVTLLMGFFALLLSFSKVDTNKYEQMKKESTKLFGGEYVVPYEKLANSLKQVVQDQGLTGQVLMEQTDEGIDITFQGALFFESGSVVLKQQAQSLLHRLIPIINDKAKNFFITIEGHTDDLPTNMGIVASNWELSSIRACTVLRLFQDYGFFPEQLKAIGWGDTRPKVENVDEVSRAINRRVVIKILKDAT